MSDYPEILYGVNNRIATITLNRPDRLNAFTAEMGSSLKQAVADANGNSEVRVIVITGAGRGFCAGADMQNLSEHASAGRIARAPTVKRPDADFGTPLGPDVRNHFNDAGLFAYLVQTKKPVIAAVNGPVAGIGVALILHADLRFAAARAVFTTSFAQRGLIAEHGLSWLLPRLVGQSNALDLLFSARKISAEEAVGMRLVNKVFAQETFMDEVYAYARLLAETVSPRSMAIMKAQVWNANFEGFHEALAVADEEMRISLSNSEFREGVAHFLEKRAPKFADI